MSIGFPWLWQIIFYKLATKDLSCRPFLQSDSDAPPTDKWDPPEKWVSLGSPASLLLEPSCHTVRSPRLWEKAPAAQNDSPSWESTWPASAAGFVHEEVSYKTKRTWSLSPTPGPERLTPLEFAEWSECLWLLIRGPFPLYLTLC